MKSTLIKWLLIILGFGLPYILIYRAFFFSGSLVWGDAPFFAPENLLELFNPPLLWNFRNDNFGSVQYYILWLYLPTYLYGVLNQLLNLNNDSLIRLIFYYPSTILALIGAWKFIGKFNSNIYSKFLGTFIYGFNSYFLMLIDGGQVGVALAYSLFPIAAFYVLNFLEDFSVKKYFFAVFTLTVLVSADIRMSFILIPFVGLTWWIQSVKGNSKKISEATKGFLILGLSTLGLNSYWVIPTVSNMGMMKLGNIGGLGNGANFVNLMDSLMLYQPHFPLNQFGMITTTPFYFVIILLLIFGNLLMLSNIKDKFYRKTILCFSLMFLFFAFLAKGGSEPFGNFYLQFVNLPGGVAFRDASKFYIPLILIGGLLISFTVSRLERLVKYKTIWGFCCVLIYGYLLFLIYPAVLGNLSGVLTRTGGLDITKSQIDYQSISSYLQKEPGFARSLWFEEKPSMFYGTWEKPAISADNLYKDRPFASMIVGKYDLFNYVYSPQFCQWLDLLGVQYILLPQNERKKIVNQEEHENRQKLLSTINGLNCLSAFDMKTSFPIYKTVKSMPLIFSQKKVFLIIGNEEIYEHLLKLPNFSLARQGFIFLEQGMFNPKNLIEADSESLALIFVNKEPQDLVMSYMQENLISPFKAANNQWKLWNNNEYLSWKYELLKKNIDSKEFDYGLGVATSTIPGEKIKFNLSVANTGNYFLAVRFLTSSNEGIKVSFLGRQFQLVNSSPQRFKWEIMGPFNMDQKTVEVEITSSGQISAINAVSLIEENKFRNSEKLAGDLSNKYQTIYIRKEQDWNNMVTLLEKNFSMVNFQQINPTEYKLNNLPMEPSWLIFTDHFDSNWGFKERSTNLHYPFYAMINGFYLDKKIANMTLYYLPQENVRIGIIISISSGVVFILTVFILILRKRWKK